MNGFKLVNGMSFVVAAVTLVFALFLFYADTNEFLGSLTAALLSAALMWMAYVLVRWLVLALK